MEYDKLVRDKIVDIILKNGETPKYREVEGEELKEYLVQKLEEEVREYQDDDEVVELADIIDVIEAILDLEGVSWEELEEIRKNKNEERGGFEKGIVLEEVSE